MRMEVIGADARSRTVGGMCAQDEVILPVIVKVADSQRSTQTISGVCS